MSVWINESTDQLPGRRNNNYELAKLFFRTVDIKAQVEHPMKSYRHYIPIIQGVAFKIKEIKQIMTKQRNSVISELS